MTKSNLTLRPVTRKFTEHRGKHSRLIRQFLESGETELDVGYDNLTNDYMGLRKAVANMGLRNMVQVRRQDGEIHLFRLG